VDKRKITITITKITIKFDANITSHFSNLRFSLLYQGINFCSTWKLVFDDLAPGVAGLLEPDGQQAALGLDLDVE
jgi:hypothetical protein